MVPADAGSLHPRITFLLDDLAAARAALTDLLAATPDAALAAPSVAGGWNGLELLEHLVIVEDGVSRMVRKLVREGLATGLPDEHEDDVTAFTAPIDAIGLAEGRGRVAAPPAVQPTGGRDRAALEAQLAEVRARLEEWLRAGSGKALGTLGWPHPFFGPLSVYQWAYVTAQHERRHTRQLARALGA
jgi:hypothetical protein